MSENELIDSVQNFIDVVKEDNRISVDALEETNASFNGVHFWLHFYMESQKLARGATNLTLAYSLPPAPSPSDVAPLVAELIVSYYALIKCYLTLPKEKGFHLAKAVSAYLSSIKTSLLHFLELFVKAIKESSGYPDLCSVGVLLEECKQGSSLPSDNRQAVIAVIQVDNDFMIDMVDEITSEMKNQINLRHSGKQGVVMDEGETEVWSETEFTIMSHSLRLAKLGRSATETALKLLKDAGGGSSTVVSTNVLLQNQVVSEPKGGANLDQNQVIMLDQLASCSSQLSPQLDNLFANTYPPIDDDDESLPALVDKFVESLRSFLSCLDGFAELTPNQKELCLNIRTQLDKTSHQLKTLLVSNEIMSIADLTLN